MIRIKIASEAIGDLEEGFDFYEVQETGIGDYFLSSLRSDIEGLKLTAGIHRQGYKDYRRLLSRVFPYAIYYTFADEVATIWAVIDCRRNPEWIRKRLSR
jgi:hypothetical protein